MPKCFKCFKNYNDISLFRKHLRYFHNFKGNERIECVENNCFIENQITGKKERQEFSKISNFYRHFREQHSSLETEESPLPCSSRSTSPASKCESSQIISVEPPSFTTSTKRTPGRRSLKDEVHNCVHVFICKLYANQSLPRSVVQEFIDYTQLLLNDTMATVEQEVTDILCQEISTDEKLEKVNDIFTFVKNPFIDFKTEYQRFKFFESQNTYIPPKSVPLYSELVPHSSTQAQHFLEMEDRSLQVIPLKQVLKEFLQQPNVFDKINEHVQSFMSESDGLISDFLQGTLWRNTINKMKLLDNTSVIWPLFLYADDFECGNVLGSHAGVHKLCGIYTSLPVLPPNYRSKLNNIFLHGIFHADDRKVVPNAVLFKPIFDEIEFLSSHGINIDTPNFKGNIRFVLSLLQGDNLGIHQMAGFVESFVAHFPCRYCHIPREVLLHQVKLDQALYKLRDPESYEADILTGNPSETGIKESSLWNNLHCFHVTENTSPDIMHDVLEGTFVLDLETILNYCVTSGYATVLNINNIIKDFNYGVVAQKNKPPLLSVSKRKVSIKMSSAEMMNFMVFFGLLVGHFFSENDPVWNLYILARQIMDILFSPCIDPESVENLRSLIQEHHTVYLQYSEEKHLRNKHHHMLHYPDLIKKLGPLINLWVMRLEAKHQHGKRVAVSVASRRNLPRTVAIRHQLMFHSYLQSGQVLSDKLEFGCCSEIEPAYLPNPCSSLPSDFLNTHQFVSWVSVYGTKYKQNMVLVVNTHEIDPVFGLIEAICLSDDNNVSFLCQKLETLFFNSHVHCYQVEHLNEYFYIEYSELCHCLPTSLSSDTAGDLFVPYRYGI